MATSPSESLENARMNGMATEIEDNIEYHSLQTPNVQSHAISDATWENKECPICLGNLHNRDDIICLEECDHIFHLPCLYNWLENSKDHSCPYCRSFINIAIRNEEAKEATKSSVVNGTVAVSVDNGISPMNRNINDIIENITINESTNCMICLDEWNHDDDDDITTVNDCQHQFHSTCLNQWLNKYGRTCPLCRNEISFTSRSIEESPTGNQTITTINENDYRIIVRPTRYQQELANYQQSEKNRSYFRFGICFLLLVLFVSWFWI